MTTPYPIYSIVACQLIYLTDTHAQDVFMGKCFISKQHSFNIYNNIDLQLLNHNHHNHHY